ncbi:PKD domain-containing protein [Kribbella italica]|uniref:PKD domain-containing protein n=1 Tax=Kribbella italica TaxID=1540520 RepID=A0A7W9JDV2_9ACTN|nr:PKD domain-containing protein [Kribbella italica]MBB5840351.1 hypothetical protein [Kribbella italica]
MTVKAIGAVAAFATVLSGTVWTATVTSATPNQAMTIGLDERALTRTPPPKPKGKMKLIKSGGTVTLSKKEQDRQEPRPDSNKSDSKKSESKIRTPAAQKRITPFRLNIGICGLPAADGGGRIGPARCEEAERLEPEQPTPSVGVRRDLPRPEDVTWEQVLAETKNVAFPGLEVKVQPAGKTLVNLDTIVYTDQAKVSNTTVTLLGFPVLVEATPMSYTWRFGDGTTVTTESPGKPYPAKEITHKYLKRGSVGITLTTNYAARFNVDGTGWQYIAGTVPITGPATPLQIQEAVPVLVDPPN